MHGPMGHQIFNLKILIRSDRFTEQSFPIKNKFLPITVLRTFLHRKKSKHFKILSIKYLCVSLGTIKRILIAVFHAVYNFETHWELKSQIYKNYNNKYYTVSN